MREVALSLLHWKAANTGKKKAKPFLASSFRAPSLVLWSRHKLSAFIPTTPFHSLVKIVSTAREGHTHIILDTRVAFSFMENVR